MIKIAFRSITSTDPQKHDIDDRCLTVAVGCFRCVYRKRSQPVGSVSLTGCSHATHLDFNGLQGDVIELGQTSELPVIDPEARQIPAHRSVADAADIERAAAARPEVMECYLMTGDSDYLLRVVVPDLEAYERFVMDFTKIVGIAQIRSSLALRTVKQGAALPLTGQRR